MGLDSIIRSGVALANKLTTSAQVFVLHEAWIGHGDNLPLYAQAVRYGAVVESGPKPFRTAQGEVIIVKAIISIIQPVQPVGGVDGRDEPIDARDRFTLADGSVGAPVMGAGGVVDPLTGRPYSHTVGIG